MSYRDDREALRQRAEDLAAELEGAREKLARREAELVERAERDADEERELAELRQKVTRLSPREAAINASKRNGFIIAAVCLFGAIVAAVISKASHPATPDSPLVIPVVPAPAPAPTPTATVTDGPTAPIVVPGVVAEVKGRKDVRVGDPCIVLADARAGSVRPKDVTVRCGDRELYRLSDLTGDVTSKWTWDLRPQTHAGVSRYALAWEDVGSRSGSRPEARIDSYQRKATLWKTGAYSVVLLLAPLSFPDGGHVIKGSSQPVEPVGVAPMRVSLSVSAVEGDTALAVGNSCALEIWQLVSEIKCRALLSCGPRVLYGDGGGGFLRCARQGSSVRSVTDDIPASKDNDGILSYDASSRSVVFDQGAVHLELTAAAPSCDASGDWAGQYWDGSKLETAELKLRGTKGSLDLGHDVLGEARRSIPVASKPGCPQARVYLEAAEAPPLLTLELGPGGDTLGGASEGGMMWLTRMEAPY